IPGVVDGLAGGRLLATAATITAILAASSVHDADSVATWHRALSTMAGVRATLEVFQPEVFDVPLDEHVAATAPRGDHSEAPGVDLGWFARWRVRSQTRRLLRPGRPPRDLYGELLKARRERNDWTALTGAGGRPEISPRLDVAAAALDSIRAGLLWLDERLPRLPGGGGLLDLPAQDLQERVDALAARPERLAIRPQVTRAFDGFAAVGLGDLVEDLASRRVAPGEVVAELDYVWWASLAQELANSDTRYAHHNGPALHRVAEAYREADLSYLDQSAGRVRAAVAQRLRETLADHPEHEAMVRAEAAKSRRHRSIRELMPVVGDTLTAIKPCWVMSPLVVASVLPPGRWFDVVVFDEASQVQPAEAMSAISRGSHVVVAGDNRQLPPTSFFTSVVDEEPAPLGEGSLTEGVESILDALAAIVPTRRLTWHYRSRDERLIAFANATMYDGSLVTFPSTGSDAVVTLESVEGTALLDAGDDAVIETTTSEVERVVALVLEHARTRPGESLGVIALGITHATRIAEALRDALRGAGDVAGFFAQTRPERFFVKNLERVQGDERDAVIVSIGFGKTLHGRVLHRFGPLNLEGGERRLNVAITRARQRLTVVSALRAEDLDPTRLRSAGALMLRDFLAYAASGGDRSADSAAVAPLAHELAERLRAHGAVVHEGYGHGSQRVDLAVEDGMAPGRMRVAVELDGPAYAQIPGVRDRERLRPQHLERLGWTHLRVWGTDVFRDPARDVARVIAAARVTVPDGAPTRSAAATTENATEAGAGTMHSADPEPTAAQVEAYVSQVGAAEVGATEAGDSAEVPATEAESAQDVPAEPDDTVDAEPEPDDTVDAEPVPTVPAGAEPEPSA
ncbi:MAG TPA: AAA domain-containing protein, partial [Candidatus Lustribacter sp.]|nr:AAA domain-containing protein [Candidatus Lustribacter sp.]